MYSVGLVEFYLGVSFMLWQLTIKTSKTHKKQVSLRNFMKNGDGLCEHYLISQIVDICIKIMCGKSTVCTMDT
jgi:hypothetical protein